MHITGIFCRKAPTHQPPSPWQHRGIAQTRVHVGAKRCHSLKGMRGQVEITWQSTWRLKWIPIVIHRAAHGSTHTTCSYAHHFRRLPVATRHQPRLQARARGREEQQNLAKTRPRVAHGALLSALGEASTRAGSSGTPFRGCVCSPHTLCPCPSGVNIAPFWLYFPI